MAPQSDLVLVVGSTNSSNSNRLREVAELLKVPAYLVDNADAIDPAWIPAAGASASPPAPRPRSAGRVGHRPAQGTRRRLGPPAGRRAGTGHLPLPKELQVTELSPTAPGRADSPPNARNRPCPTFNVTPPARSWPFRPARPGHDEQLPAGHPDLAALAGADELRPPRRRPHPRHRRRGRCPDRPRPPAPHRPPARCPAQAAHPPPARLREGRPWARRRDLTRDLLAPRGATPGVIRYA